MDRVADPAFEGFLTEQDAIDWADRSVSRTQQSGLLMDLANIESKNEFIKMWTVMYSALITLVAITSSAFSVAEGKPSKQVLPNDKHIESAKNSSAPALTENRSPTVRLLAELTMVKVWVQIAHTTPEVTR